MDGWDRIGLKWAGVNSWAGVGWAGVVSRGAKEEVIYRYLDRDEERETKPPSPSIQIPLPPPTPSPNSPRSNKKKKLLPTSLYPLQFIISPSDALKKAYLYPNTNLSASLPT